MTEAQQRYLVDKTTVHDGVRWEYVRRSPHHEEQAENPPILVQWRYHQAVRSQMVFHDGHRGPIGERAVYV